MGRERGGKKKKGTFEFVKEGIRGRRRETVGSMVGSGCFYVFRSESMTGSCVQYHSRAPTEPKRTTLQNSRDVVDVATSTCQRGERGQW